MAAPPPPRRARILITWQMNMGKGVYGLKEWGRSGVAKEGRSNHANDADNANSHSNTKKGGAAVREKMVDATMPMMMLMRIVTLMPRRGAQRCGKRNCEVLQSGVGFRNLKADGYGVGSRVD